MHFLSDKFRMATQLFWVGEISRCEVRPCRRLVQWTRPASTEVLHSVGMDVTETQHFDLFAHSDTELTGGLQQRPLATGEINTE